MSILAKMIARPKFTGGYAQYQVVSVDEDRIDLKTGDNIQVREEYATPESKGSLLYTISLNAHIVKQ